MEGSMKCPMARLNFTMKMLWYYDLELDLDIQYAMVIIIHAPYDKIKLYITK